MLSMPEYRASSADGRLSPPIEAGRYGLAADKFICLSPLAHSSTLISLSRVCAFLMSDRSWFGLVSLLFDRTPSLYL